MSDAQVGFFERLELELREAAERPVRRERRAVTVAAALGVAALVAIALVPALVILGGGDEERQVAVPAPDRVPGPAPVGTVVQRFGERHIVVATGTAPVAGPWQMETYKSERLADPDTGEEYQPTGLRCLGLFLFDAAADHGGFAGQCGEFPRTPGFSRDQHSAPDALGAGAVREILVYGRAPEQAAAVRVTADGDRVFDAERFEGPDGTRGDFYAVAVPADLKDGRVNWLDRDGHPGSRGIALLPP